MHLNVGIVGTPFGWTSLLAQEGIPYSLVKTIIPEEVSVAVVSGKCSEESLSSISSYLKSGGAVLCSSETLSRLSGCALRRSYVRYCYSQSDSEFHDIDILDLHRECSIAEGSTELRTETQESCVYSGTFGGGHIIALPFEPGEVIFDDRTGTKSFYAERSRLPFERVSLVAKRSIRKLISRSLELLHHRRGLLFVHRWYFPGGAPSTFALRIDTDGASRNEIQSLHATLSKNLLSEAKATWFVDVQSQEQWLADYSSMKGEEIGLHCYAHHLYHDFNSANNDIKQALRELNQAGIYPKGFASPYGYWNKEIGKAIEQNNFAYSSEFSYDYDNLPSFPFVGEGYSKVLQVPVHPISIGGLKRQGFSESEMKQYYSRVMEEKFKRREPLFFYHHPKDHHESVLEEIFRWVNERDIRVLRLRDYADWWKKRLAIHDQIQLDGSRMNIESENSADDIYFHVTKPDGWESCIVPAKSIDISSMEWARVPVPIPLPKNFSRIRSFNPWIPLIHFQDRIHALLSGTK